MAGFEQKHFLALGAGIVVVVGVLFLGREVMHEGALGESHNPNYGRPTKAPEARGHSTPGFKDMTEQQYYQGLKANRPDLSEAELRAKADHWWKVKIGQASVSGG